MFNGFLSFSISKSSIPIRSLFFQHITLKVLSFFFRVVSLLHVRIAPWLINEQLTVNTKLINDQLLKSARLINDQLEVVQPVLLTVTEVVQLALLTVTEVDQPVLLTATEVVQLVF